MNSFCNTHGNLNLGRRENSITDSRDRQHNLAGIPGKRMAIQPRAGKTEGRMHLAMCEALRRNGMNPEVKMYAGGLSKAVRECTKSGAARLVVMPANHPDIQVAKALLAALKLSSHHVPPIPVLPSWYTKTGVERRCFH
jgi:hypothetical protein